MLLISKAQRQVLQTAALERFETSAEQLLRERAAFTLTKLPRDAVERRLAGLSARATGIVDAVRTAHELME